MTRVPRFSKTVVIDTSFWIARYEERDRHHEEAEEKAHWLFERNILVPWPSLYETFNTRFARNKVTVGNFEALIRRPHVVRMADDAYRDRAFAVAVSTALSGRRSLSLVDVVIRLILEDTNVDKQGLLTFDPGDFSDVCRTYHIELL